MLSVLDLADSSKLAFLIYDCRVDSRNHELSHWNCCPWSWPTVPNLHFWFTTVKVKGNDSTINKRLFSYCRSKTWFFLTDSRIRKKCLKTLQLFIVFNALMTVASNKTSSSDCNLSIKALKNSSRKNHVWILDCRSRFVQPEVAVRIPLSWFSTVAVNSTLSNWYYPLRVLDRGRGQL